MSLILNLVKNFFSKPATVDFPTTTKGLSKPEKLRGMHVIDQELCTGCKRCARVCPAFVIDMESIPDEVREQSHNPKKKFMPVINLSGCIFCGECEDVCPTDALNLTNNLVVPSDVKGSLKVK